MYFHVDNDPMGYIEDFGKAIAYAAQEGKRVRIEVRDGGSLVYKIGEDTWSAPLHSTPDPYRDASNTGACQSHCDIHYFNDECVGFHTV